MGFSENVDYGQLDAPTIDYDPSFEVEEIYISEQDGFNDLIVVNLDAYVPRGTVFNLGGTEFTADTDSRNWLRQTCLETAPRTSPGSMARR